jgi:hypothetical protein
LEGVHPLVHRHLVVLVDDAAVQVHHLRGGDGG